MRLSEEDGNLFYELWFPLLDYVNEEKKVNEKLHNIRSSRSLDPNEVIKVANALWEDVGIIDEYLDKHNEIKGQERNIVIGWKRCVHGKFILERILKKGAILIFTEDDSVYRVSGIMSTWEEMFPYARLPIIIGATLIPFRDVIISDGLLTPYYKFIIGGNMAREFKDIYMEAKNSGRICCEL